ncbi:YegP family protein [Microbacterium luteum]|uniref:YegP family protein n=1 Tax=Microbacterium luteum TaxID=2782167 RepID=UPI001887F266|nr:YegP family protein [Microbacterium luteum]
MNRIEFYKRTDGKWAWRLIASNGQVIATDGGQGYENRADCERVGKAIVVGLYAPAGLE